MRASLEERFWLRGKIEYSPTCWIWVAAKDRLGYGVFGVSGTNKQAHRVAYELTYGPIPEGMVVDHKCHTKNCVKPDHLRLGTQKQNMENRRGTASNNTSGVRGVHWNKRERRWRAVVGHNGKNLAVGSFMDKADAEAAVIAKRIELHSFNDADRQGVAA